MSVTVSNNTPAPISSTERIRVVDVLRGFALFGVLLTNLWGLVMERPEAYVSRSLETPADKIVDTFVYVFFLNKFITLFSILFGYGFGMIIARLQTKGRPIFSIFSRRMLFIFLLGLVHIGFWWGEILNVYAICGFFLIFFKKLSQRHLLVLAAACIFIAGPFLQLLNMLYPSTDPETKKQVFTIYMNANREGTVADIFMANYRVMDQLFLWPMVLSEGYV